MLAHLIGNKGFADNKGNGLKELYDGDSGAHKS